MGPEQELERRDELEEPVGLEHQRGKDAEGGEDRHQRGRQQQPHDDPLDLRARGELGLQPQEGPGRAGEAEHQGHHDPDHPVKREGVLVGRDEGPRQRVERGLRLAGGKGMGLRQHRIAGDPEGRKVAGSGIAQHAGEDQPLADPAPHQREDPGGHPGAQGHEPGMVARQGMHPVRGFAAPEGPGARPGHQPSDHAQREHEEQGNDG